MKVNPKYTSNDGENKEYNYEYTLKTISIDHETQDILSELSEKLGIKKYVILRRAIKQYIEHLNKNGVFEK